MITDRVQPLTRIGIIGVGNMGSSHARHILAGEVEGLQLAAVSDTDESRLKAFPSLPGFTDFRVMLDQVELDAVIVATPHIKHLEAGVAALEAGLHLLVEKPLCSTKFDSERLIATLRSPEQVFAIVFNQRCDPAYQKIRQLVQSGKAGRIQRVLWTATNWFRTDSYYHATPWRATWAGEGGGLLVNQCCHNLDLYQWIFGMPLKVRGHCHIGKYHQIETEDDCSAWFEHADGSVGIFVASTGEAPGVNRLEIVGELGRIVFENRRLTFERNLVSSSQFSKTAKQHDAQPEIEHIEIPLPKGRGKQHLGILQNFAEAVRDNVPLIAHAQDGVLSIELANAILASSVHDTTLTLPLEQSCFESALEQLTAPQT